MITGFFLNVIYVFLFFFISLLPVSNLPSGITDALTLFAGYANAYSFLWPLGTYITVIGLAVGFEIVMLTFNASLKVYDMIRGGH